MKYLLYVCLFLITLSANAQFKEGYYIGVTGQKKAGLIRFKLAEAEGLFTTEKAGFIHFKENKKAEPVKLTISDIKGFVVEKDSFTILQNFSSSDFGFVRKDFVQVIKTGRITLYLYKSKGLNVTSTNTSGVMQSTAQSIYLISKDYSLRPIDKKEFNQDYKDLFREDAELVSKIENKKLRFDDLEEIVDAYNQFLAASKK